jgi:RNA polymerase sigma-70 factor, ECF subfamily
MATTRPCFAAAAPAAVSPIALYLQNERPAMLAFAMKLTRDRSAADDLVQATAERALAHADRQGSGANLAGWVNRIMYRLFVDDYRWAHRRCRTRSEVAIELLPAPAPEPEDDAEPAPWEWLTLADVRRALTCLPTGQREVFELFALRGLSYEETALRLGIPSRTVGTRLMRARLRLRALLQAAEHGEVTALPVRTAAPAPVPAGLTSSSGARDRAAA